MTEGATTAALVVGIDRYDAGPTTLTPLTGAVADAAAAVAWLQALDRTYWRTRGDYAERRMCTNVMSVRPRRRQVPDIGAPTEL